MLVIALEKNRIVHFPARDQQLDDFPGARAAVNIVAEVNLDCVSGWSGFEIIIDAGEELGQEIGAPVDVADSINAPARGNGRSVA